MKQLVTFSFLFLLITGCRELITATSSIEEQARFIFKPTVSMECLLNDSIQSNLTRFSQEFDSCFISKSGGRRFTYNSGLKGIGYKRGKVYKLEIRFKNQRNSIYGKKINGIRARLIKNEKLVNDFGDLELSQIPILNTDSLNYRGNSGIYMVDSHEKVSVFIYLKKNNCSVQYVKDPIKLQNFAPTKDRAFFNTQTSKLNALLY